MYISRVRNGLPPSLDLQGRLPELAMYYARTSFVPPMTSEEMQSLFYPQIRPKFSESLSSIDNLGNVPTDPVRPYRPPNIVHRSQDPLRDCLMRRNHFGTHTDTEYCGYWDKATSKWYSATGDQFFDTLRRLLYLLGNCDKFNELLGISDHDRDDSKFPQSYHCLWLYHSASNMVQQRMCVQHCEKLFSSLIQKEYTDQISSYLLTAECTLEYVLFVSVAIMLGIPFIINLCDTNGSYMSSMPKSMCFSDEVNMDFRPTFTIFPNSDASH